MKKIVFLILGLAAFAFGADGEMIRSYSVIAGGIGLGLAALGGAIGMVTQLLQLSAEQLETQV